MAPKYQFIADSLRQEIESGVYSSKQLLPTEHLLCQRFQISRQTVRRALSVLEDGGPDYPPAGQRFPPGESARNRRPS